MLGHQYSASGGQLDFVRGAYASKGGKSIIAAQSTAAKGKVSRIVARLDGPVTTPRIDTHYVVTEFGAVNLKGLSSTERRSGADRARPSRVPRRAHRSREATTSDLSEHRGRPFERRPSNPGLNFGLSANRTCRGRIRPAHERSIDGSAQSSNILANQRGFSGVGHGR